MWLVGCVGDSLPEWPAGHWLNVYTVLTAMHGTYGSSGLAILVNPRRACAARITVLGLCVCVCLSVSSNLASRSITRPTRDTNGISATWAVK